MKIVEIWINQYLAYGFIKMLQINFLKIRKIAFYFSKAIE